MTSGFALHAVAIAAAAGLALAAAVRARPQGSPEIDANGKRLRRQVVQVLKDAFHETPGYVFVTAVRDAIRSRRSPGTAATRP